MSKDNATNRVTIRVNDRTEERMEEIVDSGYFFTRSELVREGIRRVITEYGDAPPADQTHRQVAACPKCNGTDVYQRTGKMNGNAPGSWRCKGCGHVFGDPVRRRDLRAST